MRASPMSGLLSAMMISSEGTQFGLDFLVVQVHHRDFHPPKLVGEPHPVHADEFGRLAEGKLTHLEEPDGQLQRQLCLHRLTLLATGDQEVIGILYRQFSHAPNVIQGDRLTQGCFSWCGGAGACLSIPFCGFQFPSAAATAGVPFGRRTGR